MLYVVMTGGPEAMAKYISDPEAVKMLQKLTAAIAKAK